MKKFTLVIGIIMLCAGMAKAQQNRFSGGFYAGVIGSQIDGDAIYGFNHGGFNLAATVQYPISRKFFVSLELGFAQKGARDKFNPSAVSLYKINLNYIDLPVLLHFYDRKKVGLYAGLQYSRLIGSAKQTINNNIPGQYNTFYKGLSSVHNDDIQWVAGGSYYFTPNISIDFRYCYSLVSMGMSDESRYNNLATFNNLIQVRFGYIFGLEFDTDKSKKGNEQ